jgi:hypothetical protein
MRFNQFKSGLMKSGLAASVLLLAGGAAFAQQQVNLTAAPSNALLPDGNTVPMWGYSCGAVVSGSTATCAALNPTAAGSWSPVVITIPTGQPLTLNLTNNLVFTPTGGTTANAVPTSITIVGQVGGGLGAVRTTVASPAHGPQSVTWPTANSGPMNVPPTQGARVQSFATEVPAVVVGSTTAPTALTWSSLRPGTYLIESGTHPSIQGPMGLYGILVVTTAPTSSTAGVETAPGSAYPAIVSGGKTVAPAATYDGEIPIIMSEIDPFQNAAVSAAVNHAGFSELAVWSGQPGGCGNPASTNYQTCYPPAVNYTPLYYMMNGVAFSKANAKASLFPVSPATMAPATGPGSILVRLVNAGLRMHVPSIVGSQTMGFSGSGASGATVGGFQLIAEDGNRPNGVPKVQSDVFMAAGKTFDVMINAACTPVAPATTCAPLTTLPIYDRELSLSGNQINRDAGMLAYIGVNGAALPSSIANAAATANPDTYSSVIAGRTFTVSDPSKGVIANDVNVYGVTLLTAPTGGTLTLNKNGTFNYVANAGTASDSFTYCANGTVTGTTCSSGITATVTLSAATVEVAACTLTGGKPTAGICLNSQAFTANTATYLAVKTPGLLAGAVDVAGYPLKISLVTPTTTGLAVFADANGGFTATAPGAGTYTFTYQAQNSQGTTSAAATGTITFPTGSNLQVTVVDGADHKTVIKDYRWVIEEDRTFYINPNCTQNPLPANCTSQGLSVVPTLGVNFHTSYMPFIAQGCTGALSCEAGQTVLGVASVCDVSNGVCRPGTQKTQVNPSQVYLDPTKRYYISVLPGDAANPFGNGGYGAAPVCTATTAGVSIPNATCGHGMGGAPIGIDPNTGKQASAVTVLAQPSPYPTANLSVFVFEDDFPLNGEQDGGGGTVDVLSTVEPGLGGFQIHLWDAMGGNGDFTGQMTYDMFNQPLTNSLDGTLDPATGNNACPITQVGINNPGTNATNGPLGSDGTATTTAGITGMIVTCPKYESDGVTPSPLAGQAVVSNLMPGRWGVIATPAADRISRGEEWLQTNTLDGQKAHDSFTRIGEPSYFQEFGPASFHVSIGFANPAIINQRHHDVCNGADPNLPGVGNCTNSIKGRVVGEHLSRTPDERLYSTGSHDAFIWSQCYVSFGDPDGEDFAFTKCNADGTFEIDNLPPGSWRVTTFDQWNDALVDGLSTPVGLGSGANATCPGTGTSATVCDMGDVAATQWETNLYTRTFIDDNKDGVSQSTEDGIPLLNVAVRLRDGSIENLLATDFTGTANFNETFPLFSWYVVETDVTRYKNTGTHVVYDVGGPTDGSPSCGVTGYPPCGGSTIGKFLANTAELVSVPTNLRVPGAVYCANADCTGKGMSSNTDGLSSASDSPSACTTNTTTGALSCTTKLSSGRIDPPWVNNEGWQGFPGQNNFLEFGKEPYVAGENGGIKGHVIYASTRPFDDPQMLVQTQWEPLVPNVTINLYQEGVAADGVTPTLTLVDHTKTTSWDDYAQGFRSDGVTPNMNCPGQGNGTAGTAIPDLFFYSLQNQPDYLNLYNAQHAVPGTLNTTATGTALPNNSQFKCYDGMHNWNQLQPAPYDGQYQFPSVASTDANGKPNASNCTICGTKGTAPAAPSLPKSDLYYGLPQLPPGKYVVEVVVPPGFELVKEEDKNILIGDDFIAPVTQQFGGLGDIFIIPDQASVATAATTAGVGYNANNAQNPTQSLGASPNNGIVPGFVPEATWPCVGTSRVVPDYISLYPWTHQVAPFAGATRNLCDRKEVTLGDQQGAIAKFYVYTSTHTASKFTGGITDDYTSEFDPFSPQFGEKFSPPDLPVGIKDWAGNETNRVYADHWGSYNGMTYSTWEVNPPNPTGYSPTMMVFCMNDPGPILDTRVGSATNGQMITDPAYAEGYSQFCYELPFMPGTTQYLDTPVVPTSAFAGAGYNNVDCAYPDATPAVAAVVNSNAETGTGNPVSNTLPAGSGPWVSGSGTGHQLTITALGPQTVPNNAYSGPSATTAPYNQKTIVRHYGFGTQCTAPTPGNATCNALSKVTIGGVAATINSWTVGAGTTPDSITVTVPSGVPACLVQQQSIYGGPTSTATAARCGELVITAGNGKQSVDAVSVTVGGKTPTLAMKPGATAQPLSQYSTGTIQNAIDAAAPGDLIILPAGAYSEMVLMWKPVRLQGVGAASTVINANTQPAGKLDPWRREVDCLFGLALDGVPLTATHSNFDPTGNGYTCAAGTKGANFTGTATTLMYFSPQLTGTSSSFFSPQIDRLPLEAVVGWDATLNGNLAQLLQEATLMGALEGAGVTVLGKGVHFPSNSNPFAADTFPVGTTLLSSSTCAKSTAGTPLASNFYCNPSSINSLGITDSSQGGGAVFLHAWGHNIEIANNRIKDNAGTLSGGINVGQGEFPPAYIAGGTTNADPGSCATTGRNGRVTFGGQTIPNGAVEPYCQNVNVNVHNNYVSLNSSTGDELFSATPAGAGGVSFCTGADNYKFNYNWVCGNLSSGDGGGLGHFGLSYNGDIEHNTFLFNQSLNPTIPANGGAMIVMGAPDVDPPCSTVDQDCVSAPGAVGPSDGVGPGLVINANLIMGNGAEAGTGGGISFQNVNGSDVVAFPNTPGDWWHVTVTNNIIADNVAGWDGAGISLLDTLNIDIVNNTIVANSTTASAGVLFTTLGAPLASQPGNTGSNPSSGINCTNGTATASCPQVAGLVSEPNSSTLNANLPAAGVVCPANHYTSAAAAKGNCMVASVPALYNNLIWQNSAYYIGVGAISPAFQQSVVALYNAFTTTLAPSQPSADATAANGAGSTITGGTGACMAASYWDIGVRGDLKPGDHTSGVTLAPTYSTLTSALENGLGTHNELATNPDLVSQYCDGSRQPPEWGQSGWAVPPGISDATVPNPIFNLTPVATVDEGNNWINLRWGPLTLVNPVTGAVLGNYAPAAGSPVIDVIPTSSPTFAVTPRTDYFGNPRPATANGTVFSIGAVEVVSSGTATLGAIAPSTGAFGSWVIHNPSTAQFFLYTNTGTTSFTTTTVTLSDPTDYALSFNGCANEPLNPGQTCTIAVVFTPSQLGALNGTLTVNGPAPASINLTGTGIAPTATLVGTLPQPFPANFGTVVEGQVQPVQQIYSYTNTSVGNFTITGTTLSDAIDYSIAFGNCTAGKVLAPNGSCTVQVQFNPHAVGVLTATLSVTGPAPQSVTLTGTGTYTPSTLTFTPTGLTTGTANGTTKTGLVTVRNTGPGTVSLTAVPTVTGNTGTGTFSTYTPTGTVCTAGTVLASGATCRIGVRYVPPTTGSLTSTAHVTVTDTGTGATAATVTTQNSANFNGN